MLNTTRGNSIRRNRATAMASMTYKLSVRPRSMLRLFELDDSGTLFDEDFDHLSQPPLRQAFCVPGRHYHIGPWSVRLISHDRSRASPAQNFGQIACFADVEHDDGNIIFATQGNGAGIHDLQIVSQNAVEA